MRIKVIGGGWYGCHVASTLLGLGMDVTLFEASNSLLKAGASGANQFRLHMGFHYARNYRTRLQSRDGYQRFIERYPFLSNPISNNIYAVPKYDSLIDYKTYKAIMMMSGIEFRELSYLDPNRYGHLLEGAMEVDERVIMTEAAVSHFEKALGDNVVYGEKVEVVEDASYDYVIDCTWGALSTIYGTFFEPCVLFTYYNPNPFGALTLVDGPLCSIYPTERKGIYTLSSVPHTPLGSFMRYEDAKGAIDRFSSQDALEKRNLMEQQVSAYYPSFNDEFQYLAPQLSIKTKPHGANDDRSCTVIGTGKVIRVMSGKIDTIFYATEKILEYISSRNK